MINAWNLVWIVPLSAAFGVFFMALLQVGTRAPDWDDDHDVSGLLEED
jgi:hypothetical protein